MPNDKNVLEEDSPPVTLTTSFSTDISPYTVIYRESLWIAEVVEAAYMPLNFSYRT